MPDPNVDLQFPAKQVQSLIEETRHVRKELGEVRTLTLQTYEFARRVERRHAELRDDLEIAVKMELGGGMASLQTSLESTLSRIVSSVEDLAHRVDALERGP